MVRRTQASEMARGGFWSFFPVWSFKTNSFSLSSALLNLEKQFWFYRNPQAKRISFKNSHISGSAENGFKGPTGGRAVIPALGTLWPTGTKVPSIHQGWNPWKEGWSPIRDCLINLLLFQCSILSVHGFLAPQFTVFKNGGRGFACKWKVSVA